MSGAVARSQDGDKDKSRVQEVKVKRWRPGQLPDWAKEEEDDDLVPAAAAAATARPSAPAAAAAAAPVQRTGS